MSPGPEASAKLGHVSVLSVLLLAFHVRARPSLATPLIAQPLPFELKIERTKMQSRSKCGRRHSRGPFTVAFSN